MARVVRTPMEVLKTMLVDQRGRSPTRALRFSTCCTVHSLHGFEIVPSNLMSPSVISAARLKNLHGHKSKGYFVMDAS